MVVAGLVPCDSFAHVLTTFANPPIPQHLHHSQPRPHTNSHGIIASRQQGASASIMVNYLTLPLQGAVVSSHNMELRQPVQSFPHQKTGDRAQQGKAIQVVLLTLWCG